MPLGGPSELSLCVLSASTSPVRERRGKGWRVRRKERSEDGGSGLEEEVREGGSEGVRREGVKE